MKRTRALFLCLALLPLPTLAQTKQEEEDLFKDEESEEQFFKLEEDAVTIASKHEQSTREAPASITVLNQNDIFRYGFRDMSDLLRAVSGWFASDGHDFAYGGVRGILLQGDQNSRILVLIDGHTANELWSSSSSLDEALGIDLEQVARVEILQGPSSTLYGTNAFLGIVNIVTKSGGDMSRASASLDLGSFGRTGLQVSSGMKKGDLQYHVTAGVRRDEGQFYYFPDRAETSPTAGFTSPSSDEMSSYRVFGKLQYKSVQVLAQFADRTKHLPTAPFNTVLNSDYNWYRQQRWFVEAKLNRELSEKASLMARVYYDGYQYKDLLKLNGETPEDCPACFQDLGQANWVGSEVQLGLTLADADKVRDQLYVGLEASYLNTRSQAFDVEDCDALTPVGDPVDIPRTGFNTGAYVQNELAIGQMVNFVGGLRFDYNSNFFGNASALDALSPRAALIFRTRQDSTFKLLYSKGFRNPSIYEAFFQDGLDIADNPTLKPESIQNVELVYEYRFKKLLKLGLATYYFRATNLLKQTTVELPQDDGSTDIRQRFENVGQLEGQGSELTVQAQLPMGLQARGTMALQRALNLDDNQPLNNSPSILGNLMVSYPLYKDKYFLSGQLHVVGPRTAGVNDAGARVTVPTYALGNIVFSARDLVKGFDLSAGVYNVLDQCYQDVAVSEEIVVDYSDTPVLTVPTDGRTFSLKLSYRF